MDNYDKKIKKIVDNEEWKIPQDIDCNISNILDDLDTKVVKKNMSLKVAILVATLSALTITSAFALEYIIKYFDYNKESLYETDKSDLEKTGTELNLTVEDKGIAFTIDSISVDDNYMTIFHTARIDKNIKEMKDSYKDAYFANPIEDLYIDGENVSPPGMIEQEATYISDNELKGIHKIDISNIDIPNDSEIELRVDEIFGVEGKWSIFTSIDKSKSEKETYNYDINKTFKINRVYDYNKEKVEIEHDVTIEKVIISPLANKIIIKEKRGKIFDDWSPMLGNSFALFDDKGKSLDVVDRGAGGYDRAGIAINSEEFLKADVNTKSLTLVPISYDYDIENNELELENIDNLPIIFETSEYGKLVVEDIEITDKQIKYTYYKDGVVPHYPNLWFYDENGKEISFSRSVKESLDRSTGRYTTILNIYKKGNNIQDIKNIKKISTFSQNDMKLLYDQQIKIDLIK